MAYENQNGQQGQGKHQGQKQYQEQNNLQDQNQQQKQESTETDQKKKNFSFDIPQGNKLDAELRKPRSRAYMEIFTAIDMLSATDEEIIERLKSNMEEDTAEDFSNMTKEELLEEIKASFQEEFQNLPIEITHVLKGVLSKCYIDGCDCHAIDSNGNILEHFQKGGPIPSELAKGRIVYHKYPKCTCIEVYNDCCRVIADDASVITIYNDDIK